MNKVSHKNNSNRGAVQLHMHPSPVPLIKIENDMKLDKDCVKIRLHGYPTSENSVLCEFKISLFELI